MREGTRRLLIPCAAALLTAGASMMSYAAVGWQNNGGVWSYVTSGGEQVQESWKKSGNYWFWLGSDGELTTDALISDDDDYYYVNEMGAQVSNEWRELDDEDSDNESGTSWYYFGPNGKAYRASESGKTSFKSIKKADGTTRKYAFDSEGRMLYGWVNEDSERLDDEDAWRSGTYYLGEEGDGAMTSSAWAKLEVEDDASEDDDFDGSYWFYFNANGKKAKDTTKTINGRKYLFREDGNAEFKWHQKASGSVASSNNIYYNEEDQCWQAVGWFKTVPGENVDPEAYEDDEEYWFYAQKSGEVIKSEIKKIGGQYYAFNEYGEMLYGLYKMSVDDREVISYEEIEGEDDLPDEDEDLDVYYFGDSPKEGVMKTGTITLDVDGEDYTYNFQKSGSSRGAGYDGINDGALYRKGRLMKADKDSKLEAITYEGKEYLVNTSGKIQKKKTNSKDADDMYYCTDSQGVITYKGSEKWEKEK